MPTYKLFAIALTLIASVTAAADDEVIVQTLPNKQPQSFELEVGAFSDDSARQNYLLNRALEFTARSALAEGKDDYTVRNFNRIINVHPVDIYQGVAHAGVTLFHGSCASVGEVVSQAIQDWRNSVGTLAKGAKCLKDSVVDCEMTWRVLSPDHLEVTLTGCYGASAKDFSLPVVVETVPKSDTRVEIVRIK